MKNSMTKKILSILLAVMMVVGMIPATVIPAYAADEATCPIEGATGAGTETDPIIVDTYEELDAALKLENAVYVLVEENTSIICQASLEPTNNKTLTVNGEVGIYDDNLLELFYKGNFTLQGEGTLYTATTNNMVSVL